MVGEEQRAYVGNGEIKFANNDLMSFGDLVFDSFDELLDFSCEEEAQMLSEPLVCPSWEDPLLQQPPPPPVTSKTHGVITASSSPIGEDVTLLCDDLDVAQLEWLSNFVEESFSPTTTNLLNTTTNTTVIKDGNGSLTLQYRTPSPVSVLEQSSGLVGLCSYSSSSSSPTSSSCSGVLSGMKVHITLTPPEPMARGPRTKRPRPASFSPSSSLIPFTTSSSTTTSPPVEDELPTESNGPAPILKKKKLKKLKVMEPSQTPSSGERRCMHCQIQKTPQWRAGPMGPKTLCNACGVRYKSGRLFPEYRPAASPTFVAALHSNSHKKVVEMRNKVGPNEEAVAAVALKGCELVNYIRSGNGNGNGNGNSFRV